MSSEKTHDALPGKIERAIRDGNLPRSHELTSLVTFLAVAWAAFASIPQLGVSWRAMLFQSAVDRVISWDLVAPVIGTTLSVLVVGIVVSSLATILQGGRLTFKAPKFDLNRLRPDTTLKHIYSSQFLVVVGKTSLLFATAAVIVLSSMRDIIDRALGTDSVEQIGALAIDSIVKTVLAFALGDIAFVLLDVILTKQRWKKSLRMTTEEFRRELKEMFGDPLIRHKRKRMFRMFRRTAAKRKPAFAVVNPTHITALIAYAPPAVSVPLIVDIGRDARATALRQDCYRRDIPIVENITLARLLFRQATIGQVAPPETFAVLAEIIVALGLAPDEVASA